MVVTAAHIPAIVALIAGILILIGLVGLGLLRWLHM